MDLQDVFLTEGALPDPLPEDPFPVLEAWLADAVARKDTPNPNAMTLATVDAEGRPSARIVLCKALDADAGEVVFYTNRTSRKGAELDATGKAAVVFHWDHQERQARVEGEVRHASEEESDAYFASRRWESRLSAWVSDQSKPIESRDELLTRAAEVILELDLDLKAIMDGDEVAIPRPPHWGGYRLRADAVELWSGATGRLHDRAVWTRDDGRGEHDSVRWVRTRLQP